MADHEADHDADHEADHEAEDNGYDTDNEYDIDITEENTLLLKNYIIESLKHTTNTHNVRQLFNNIIRNKIIYSRYNKRELIQKPYNDGIVNKAYLHSPEIDDIMYAFLSPRITKIEYDSIIELEKCIEEPEYGSKYIESIKFYSNYIIIILNGDKKQIILKIYRQYSENEACPLLTVYESGNILILDWNHPTNFSRNIGQFSKLVFTKTGIVTDINWINKEGNEYREDLLPSHIALRPNRFHNCWYLNYNSKLQLQDNTNEVVNFTIYCCDS